MDFIFLIGPSAVGKTTLAKQLYQHYGGVYLEQSMVPEFCIPNTTADEGIYEEQLCWENVLLQMDFFHRKGYQYIFVLDFDDIRARELPRRFAGCRYLILRLISSKPEQIKRQMEHRHQNEGGLYVPQRVERTNQVIRSRPLLPNELMLDVADKTKEEVLEETIHLIDDFCPKLQYDYEEGPEEHYLSWVQSKNLT